MTDKSPEIGLILHWAARSGTDFSDVGDKILIFMTFIDVDQHLRLVTNSFNLSTTLSVPKIRHQ